MYSSRCSGRGSRPRLRDAQDDDQWLDQEDEREDRHGHDDRPVAAVLTQLLPHDRPDAPRSSSASWHDLWVFLDQLEVDLLERVVRLADRQDVGARRRPVPGPPPARPRPGRTPPARSRPGRPAASGRPHGRPAKTPSGAGSGTLVVTVSVLANRRSRSSSGRPIVRSVVLRMATRSHRRSASSRRWVVRKIVTPRWRRSPIRLVDVARGEWVEPRGRLVKEQDLRVAEQRSRQGDPLAKALGQRAADVVRAVGQAHRAKHPVDAGARFGHFVEVREALEVLADTQTQVQARRFGHHRDPPADLHAVLGRERYSRHRRRPGRRLDERAERPDRRRLARAVRAKEPEDLASSHVERDVVEGHPVAEALGQMTDRERRLRAGSGSRRRLVRVADHRVRLAGIACVGRRPSRQRAGSRGRGGPSAPRFPDSARRVRWSGGGPSGHHARMHPGTW